LDLDFRPFAFGHIVSVVDVGALFVVLPFTSRLGIGAFFSLIKLVSISSWRRAYPKKLSKFPIRRYL